MTDKELEELRGMVIHRLQQMRAATRTEAELKFGTVWDPIEFERDFNLEHLSPPLVIVVRKLDGKRGSLMFQPDPRFYHSFQEMQ